METIRFIEKTVCSVFGITSYELAKTTKRNIVAARYLIYYFIRLYQRVSLNIVAERYGQSYCNVSYGLKVTEDRMQVKDEMIYDKAKECERLIQEKYGKREGIWKNRAWQANDCRQNAV